MGQCRHPFYGGSLESSFHLWKGLSPTFITKYANLCASYPPFWETSLLGGRSLFWGAIWNSWCFFHKAIYELVWLYRRAFSRGATKVMTCTIYVPKRSLYGCHGGRHWHKIGIESLLTELEWVDQFEFYGVRRHRRLLVETSRARKQRFYPHEVKFRYYPKQ